MYKFLDLIHCQRDGYVLDLVIEDENYFTNPKDALKELERVGAEFEDIFKTFVEVEDTGYPTYLVNGTLYTQDLFGALEMLEDMDWDLPQSEPECRCKSCGCEMF